MFEPEEGAHKQNPNLNPNQTHIDQHTYIQCFFFGSCQKRQELLYTIPDKFVQTICFATDIFGHVVYFHRCYSMIKPNSLENQTHWNILYICPYFILFLDSLSFPATMHHFIPMLLFFFLLCLFCEFCIHETTTIKMNFREKSKPRHSITQKYKIKSSQKIHFCSNHQIGFQFQLPIQRNIAGALFCALLQSNFNMLAIGNSLLQTCPFYVLRFFFRFCYHLKFRQMFLESNFAKCFDKRNFLSYKSVSGKYIQFENVFTDCILK